MAIQPRPSCLHDYFYLWSALIDLIVFLLALIGFASPAWRVGVYGSDVIVQTGLIMRCHYDGVIGYQNCAPFTIGFQSDWFEASRVCCSIAIAFTFALVIACAFLHITDKKRNDFLYPNLAAIIVGCLGCVGAIVFASFSDSMLPSYTSDLSWGWAVYFVMYALLMILSFVMILVMRKFKQPIVPKQVAPQRDQIFYY